jgi:hypothetical protein
MILESADLTVVFRPNWQLGVDRPEARERERDVNVVALRRSDSDISSSARPAGVGEPMLTKDCA